MFSEGSLTKKSKASMSGSMASKAKLTALSKRHQVNDSYTAQSGGSSADGKHGGSSRGSKHGGGGTAVAKRDVEANAVWAELHSDLMDQGSQGAVLDGIFHNYLSVGYSDPSFTKTEVCSDWLAWG